MRTPSLRPSGQQRSNQPGNTILAQGRRRPSPLSGNWAGSTFVKMVGETARRANHVLMAAPTVILA
jgi:hypothetical protein